MTSYDGLPCSAAALDLPLPGSATRVTGWLCVEQPGAWGRDVIGDEVLGPEITPALAALAKAAHVRPTLIRRPGRKEFSGVRTVLIASSRPEGSWCERFEITDLKQLLDLDLHLLNGPAPKIGVPVTDPILVCAHGKRDQCCARLGRPIAARLAAAHPDRVWECSHTGGHRFAPAVVLLPTGLTYGRIDEETAVDMIATVDRGLLPLTGFRGRSCSSPVEQVAEIAVREHLSTTADWLSAAGIDDLTATETTLDASPAHGAALPVVAPTDATYAGAALVTHRDGRQWLVTTRTHAHTPRQASCGASPKPATALVPAHIEPLH
ncbi:sucrase ferredoxin [Nocardia sp. NPDC050406]|uniref:sucrase ferredoxin n=1 Tax=Nocardia sp. NPDC050406 TaxID=3364318 RepID=UPI00378C6A19